MLTGDMEAVPFNVQVAALSIWDAAVVSADAEI